jgi:hypothetical protein
LRHFANAKIKQRQTRLCQRCGKEPELARRTYASGKQGYASAAGTSKRSPEGNTQQQTRVMLTLRERARAHPKEIYTSGKQGYASAAGTSKSSPEGHIVQRQTSVVLMLRERARAHPKEIYTSGTQV